MMKNIFNICLITLVVIHVVCGDIGRSNRRVKRLPSPRNASNKIKKGEKIFFVDFSKFIGVGLSFFGAIVKIVDFLNQKLNDQSQ